MAKFSIENMFFILQFKINTNPGTPSSGRKRNDNIKITKFHFFNLFDKRKITEFEKIQKEEYSTEINTKTGKRREE